MSTEHTDKEDEMPEEEAGIEVSTMDADYDEGDDIPSLKTIEVTASFEQTWANNTGRMYKSSASAIDEGLGNAITAVRRAHDLFDAWDAGVIVRIEEESKDEVYLTIRDEGIGMTEEFVENVLSDIGTTTGVAGEGVNSKFGRGFFALFMLVGEGKNDASGSFTMSTNPRMEDNGGELEPPYNIVQKPGEMECTAPHNAALDEDEYGTRLRFCIRDGITADDLERWVRNYGAYSRTPVMFERKYPDGSMENDELGGKSLEHNYSDDAPTVVVEREGLYRAVASPEAKGRVVILDAQTEASGDLSFPLYPSWNVDIRLLSEDGPIFDSPDDSRVGKIPVSEEDMADVPDHRKDDYILKSKVNEYDDERMAEPSGTRDIIDLSDAFREEVFESLKHKALDRIKRATSNLSDPEDWANLTDEQANLIGNIIEGRRRRWNLNSVVDNDTLDLLQTLSRRFKFVKKGADIVDRHDLRRDNIERRYAYELQREYDDVYYGNSILQRRADAVWADGDNAVVKVKTSEYDSLDSLGWTKITEITSTTVDDLDVSDSIVEEFKSVYTHSSSDNSGVADSYDDRQIKLHHVTYPNTTTTTVGKLRDHFGDDMDDYESDAPDVPDDIGRLVVFTSTSDEGISDHKTLADDYTATAKCVNKVFEEKLSHLDNVIRYEDYGDHNDDYELLTNEGRLPVGELTDRDVRFVNVESEWKEWLESATSQASVGVLSNLLSSFDGIVAVVTKYDLYAIRSHLEEFNSDARDNSISLAETLYINHGDTSLNLSYEGGRASWKMLVEARLPNWDADGTPETRCLINNFYDADRDEKQTLLDKYGSLHDNGEKMSSDRDMDITSESVGKITLDTNKGEMTVAEIKESDMRFAIFPLTDDVQTAFGDVSLDTVQQFLSEKLDSTASYRRHRRRIDYTKSNYILAVEDYETTQRLAREMSVYVVKPSNAPSVANQTRRKRAGETYTSLYAYHKAQELGIDPSVFKGGTDADLISEGYHFVNTTAQLLADE